MSNRTPNLNLEKPLQEEFYDVDVQNGNMDILDAAVEAIKEGYVKKSGDTMTGNLNMDDTAPKSIRGKSNLVGFEWNTNGLSAFDYGQNQNIWSYMKSNKHLYLGAVATEISGSLLMGGDIIGAPGHILLTRGTADAGSKPYLAFDYTGTQYTTKGALTMDTSGNYSLTKGTNSYTAQYADLALASVNVQGDVVLDTSGQERRVYGGTGGLGLGISKDGMSLYDWGATKAILAYTKADQNLYIAANVSFHGGFDIAGDLSLEPGKHFKVVGTQDKSIPPHIDMEFSSTGIGGSMGLNESGTFLFMSGEHMSGDRAVIAAGGLYLNGETVIENKLGARKIRDEVNLIGIEWGSAGFSAFDWKQNQNIWSYTAADKKLYLGAPVTTISGDLQMGGNMIGAPGKVLLSRGTVGSSSPSIRFDFTAGSTALGAMTMDANGMFSLTQGGATGTSKYTDLALASVNVQGDVVLDTSGQERQIKGGTGQIGIGISKDGMSLYDWGSPRLILSYDKSQATSYLGINTVAQADFRVKGRLDVENGLYGNLHGTADSATAATTAGLAAKLSSNGTANGTPMTFNWSGQAGQPTWLWGGDKDSTGTQMYVYNPANFNVNSVGGYTAAQLMANSGGIVAQSWGANGYVKFSGGFMMQWGEAKSYSDNAFPIAFPNNALQIVMTGSVIWTFVDNTKFHLDDPNISDSGKPATRTYVAFGY